MVEPFQDVGVVGGRYEKKKISDISAQSPKGPNNMERERELSGVKDPLEEEVDSTFRAGYHFPDNGLNHFGLLYVSG